MEMQHLTDFIIRQKALTRWLFSEEIYFLLTLLQIQDTWNDIGRNIITLSSDPPRNPKNGDLFVYDKRLMVGYRDDGIAWMKKKGAKSRLQETYQSIKIEGVEVISGVYSRAEDDQNFSRRIYRMTDDSDKFVLIHYRQSEKRESAPTGRQDQHPQLMFLLSRIRLEYYNLSISRLPNNSAGDNELTQTSHHLGEASGIGCYESNSEALPLSYTSQSWSGNYLRPIFTAPPHPSQYFSSSNSNSNSHEPVSDFITDPLHGCSPSYNPSHQMDTARTPQLVGGYYNETHLHMQSCHEPEITPSDLEFLLDMSDCDSNPPLLPVIKMDPCLVITDFSPSTCSGQGGTKILVCLDSKTDLSKVAAPGMSFFINFGSAAKTVAEVLTSTVLRCMSPPVEAGSYPLWISDSHENALSMKSAIYMDVTPSSSSSSSSIQLSATDFSSFLCQKVNNDRTSQAPVDRIDASSSKELSKSTGVKHARSAGKSSSLQLANASYSSGFSERENKIRIVEKLGYMRSSLKSTRAVSSIRGSNSPATQDIVASDDEESHCMADCIGNSINTVKYLSENVSSMSHVPILALEDEEEPSPPQSKGAFSFHPEDGDEWLDENQLSNLSIEELENEMDKNIMAVVKQMVQLASLDDDLKTEIDSLDSNGFSLLHYCCLYNLNSLIPVLLARGATVNKKSYHGSTPLHLSASAGNLAVCELLIKSGASLLEKDSAGLLAKDIAQLSAQHQISRYLQAAEDRLTSSDNRPRECIAWNAVAKNSNSNEKNAMSKSLSNPRKHFEVHLTLPSDATRAMQVVDSGSEAREAAFSNNKLLQQAFSSLSLTDKCALSLTLSQQQFHSNNSSNLLQSSPIHSAIESSPSTSSNKQRSSDFTALGDSASRDAHSSLRLFQHSESNSCVSSSAQDDSDREIDVDVSLGVGADFDMQSVLSEVDKESLGAAMKMMGNADLQQVEEEVRKIQNNVRGWLLRKNYVNLREAAKVLQMAWREKRKTGSSASAVRLSSPPLMMSSSFKAAGGSLFEDSGSSRIIPSDPLASSFFKSISVDAKELNDLESIALARLQARTRGMLARKSFSSIRKQAMASLVIQKSLIKWWQNKGDNNSN